MTDESIFREVDEEVRQDEYKKLWDRHGKLFTAAAAAVVLAVAAYQGYRYYEKTQSEVASLAYFDALKKAADNKPEDALAALKAINHKGYGELAKFQEADVLAQKGEVDKAITLLDGFAADKSNEATLTDLAAIKAGYLRIDSSKPDELIASLGKFDKDGQVWRHQAREIFGLTAWRTGDYAMADRYMKALFDDPETPQTMRERAQVMIQLIAPLLPKK
jgi:hypothetical protein